MRFCASRGELDADGVDPCIFVQEIRSTGDGHYARTASRSLVGLMNEFTFLGNVHREDHGAEDTSWPLPVRLAEAPTSLLALLVVHRVDLRKSEAPGTLTVVGGVVSGATANNMASDAEMRPDRERVTGVEPAFSAWEVGNCGFRDQGVHANPLVRP